MNLENIINNIKLSFKPQPDGYDKRKNYKIGPILGEGSFGQVKLAKNLDTQENVAIKIVHKIKLKEESYLIQNELETVKLLNHKNIVKLLDHFESNHKYYLVFELAEGGELFSRLSELGKFTENDAIYYVHQLLSAVKYLHEHNIVHRDIKPENLLLKDISETPILKLSDFGISKIIKSDDECLTTQCGSPSYLAPEILANNGSGYHRSVDLWGVGLSGENPFGKFTTFTHWLHKTKNRKYTYDSYCWTLISKEDPIPNQRMTAVQALDHPWILHTKLDSPNLKNIRENFEPKLIYKKAFDKLKIIQNFKHNIGLKSSLEELE